MPRTCIEFLGCLCDRGMRPAVYVWMVMSAKAGGGMGKVMRGGALGRTRIR